MENNKPYWELLKDEPKEKQDEFYAGLERMIQNAESKKPNLTNFLDLESEIMFKDYISTYNENSLINSYEKAVDLLTDVIRSKKYDNKIAAIDIFRKISDESFLLKIVNQLKNDAENKAGKEFISAPITLDEYRKIRTDLSIHIDSSIAGIRDCKIE